MDTTKESRVARDAFDFSLTLGEAHQNSLAKLMMEGRCARITVECKADLIARRTARVFVEMRQQGRPSGLAISKADYYLFEIEDETGIFMPTRRLKRICNRVYEAYPKRRVKGGDNDNEGLLVYLTELLSGIPNPSEPDSKP